MAAPKAKVILQAERRGAAAFKSFQDDLKKVGRAAAVAAAAVAAGTALIVKSAFEQIDALAKTSDLLGINTRALSALQFAGELTGNSTRNLNLGLQRMTRRIAEASQGMGEAQSALKELGLDAEALTRMPLEEQFEAVSQALVQVESQSQKVRLGFKLFDSEGVALLRTSELLAEKGLAGITQEADRLGIAISRVDASAIEDANDAILRARARVQGVGNVIAIQLAPIVTALANRFTDVGESAVSMSQRVQDSIDFIASGVGIVADALHGWQILLNGIAIATNDASLAMAEFAGRFNSGIAEAAANERILSDEAHRLFENLVQAEKPSVIIASNILRARVEAQKAAEAVQRLAEDAIPVTDPGESAIAATAREAAEKAEQTRIEALQRGLDTTVAFQRTAEESEIFSHQRRAEIIQQAFEDELVSRERAVELQQRLYFDHQERLTEIELAGLSERDKFVKMSAQSQTAHVLGSLVQMTQGVANSNKTMFKLNKLSAIGSAVVNTAQGVTRALAEYPPPLSFAMAAAVAAAGLAQISAIRSTSFGGGTTPSVAGTVPTLREQPIVPPPSDAGSGSNTAQTVVQVNIQGIVGTIDPDTAEAIGVAIGEVIDDKDFVLISPNSRNAIDIVEAAG